ncbi:alcohol dehydrogenase zinc-containing [Mizugakiibacter sediminis]|uniref:Zinc-type alcohol dehydrogenase-like protein n=1 Tax=Mizugakiibacter sediminis TaxID=1475481 RepID=A0A0K8QKL6_9GAMM|nr:zinc-binding alcohol dehydrogenase family protein [Mizugakiibacter sediminis]GAP65403.1 alcohol dehydrogenase zinc-containing [Mizugakiibacter sediminis]
MKAVALTRYLPIDDPESLIDVELPTPTPAGHDLRVRVEAVSVNPVDTKVRAPKAAVEAAPRVLGWDAAGVVEAVGEAVTLFKPGDRVYYAGAIDRPGCNAEFHLVDERIVGPMPRTLDFAEAAALPLTALTAWELLFERFGFDADGADRDRTLLMIAGAGGLGSIAIQLAKRAGLTAIATASRAETVDWCRRMGADHVVDHRQPLKPQLEALGFAAVDAIVCFTAAEPYWAQMTDLVAPQGRIGLVVGMKQAVDLEPLKSKSASVHWEYMFTRAQYRTPDMIAQHRILARVAALVDAGALRSTLTGTLAPINAANLRVAHARLESGRSIGKLVLRGWG